MTISQMRLQIEEYLSTLKPETTKIELAFYGGSFTGIPSDTQESYLRTAHEYLEDGKIHGIRLSTRPDYMDDEVINRLKRYQVALVELGVQSLDEEVLLASKRGYKSDVVYESVDKLHKAGIQVGIQLMIGLPLDSLEKTIETTNKVLAFHPSCIRIYPTLVIQDTLLQTLYQEGSYTPLDLETAVTWTAIMALTFKNNNIPIIRMGLQPTDLITKGESVLAGPFHPAFRQLVESRLIRDQITNWLSTQSTLTNIKPTAINTFQVFSNPKTQSLLIGQKRSNLDHFNALGYKMTVGVRTELEDGEIEIEI